MADIEVTFEGDKADILGETEEGTDFINRYFPSGEYQVLDEGHIVVEVGEIENFAALAKADGLFVRTSE